MTPPIDIPLWAYKMALRLLNLTKRAPFVTVHLFRVEGVWYLQTGDNEPERLG